MPPRLTGVQPPMERRSAPRLGRFLTVDRVRSASCGGVSRMQAGGRFAPVGAAFRGYLRGQSLCGLWNDPVCLTVFSRRAAPGGSRFAASRTLRPPFSRLTGRVCTRMGEERSTTPWQRPFGGAERRERTAGGVWRAFQRECLHILSRPAPVKCTSACNGGQKSAERAAGLHLWPRGRAASRVGSPALERRFTGSAGLRASRAGGWEPARGPEKRAGGRPEPPDRAGAFLCSKERTGYPAPHTHPCRARPAARPPCPRAGTKEPDPAAEGLETGLALRAAARHLTAARNGGCVLLRCPRR